MSSSIDFYLLKDTQATAAAMLACRLAEKAYGHGNSAFIYCDNAQNADAINQLLWTFKEDSFIPHARAGTSAEKEAPIVIGSDLTATTHDYDILINLHPQVNTAHVKFSRILDIVANDPMLKEHGRQRYRYYREAQYPLNLHEL